MVTEYAFALALWVPGDIGVAVRPASLASPDQPDPAWAVWASPASLGQPDQPELATDPRNPAVAKSFESFESFESIGLTESG